MSSVCRRRSCPTPRDSSAAPIRLQIASLEDASVKAADAAATASERLSGQLVDLLRVIAETEARVDEVDTRMDVRARDTLAARSLRLVDSLQEASVDIAKLLAIDVPARAPLPAAAVPLGEALCDVLVSMDVVPLQTFWQAGYEGMIGA